MVTAVLALLMVVGSDQSSYVGWGSKSDRPVKAGEAGTQASAVASVTGNFIAEALAAKYPCGNTSTQSDVSAQLGYERMRQLLGGEATPDLLAAVGGAVGARNVIYVTVTQTGANVFVNVVSVDSTTGKATARQGTMIQEGPGMANALEAFAKGFVGGLGASIPRCAGKDWAGLVKVTYELKADNKVDSQDSHGELSCRLYGDGGKGRCSYNAQFNLRGPGGAVTTTKTGSDDVGASAGVSGSTLKISIGAMLVKVKLAGPEGINVESEQNLSGESFEVPATASPTNQSGQKVVTESAIGKVTVTWALSKPAK